MKKNILLLSFLILLTFPLKSQEFDQKFLESLPPDVRQDLLDQTQIRNDAEKPQYRRPSSFIEKKIDNVLDRFGSEIFNSMQTSLMPINEPNFDSDYNLDFGDEITIQLVGQKSEKYTFNIQRDGSIFLPEVGKLYLSGQTLEDSIKIIKENIKKTFIGVEAFISLTNVRDIQVIVAGNVFNPGTYTLNGNSNIFHALNISGGPSDIGSFRSIRLIRNNETIDTLDLYNTFISGEASFNIRLRSGDLIFVDPIFNLVTLVGGFKRPGIYEFLENETFESAMLFGNGLNNLADTSNIKIFSISEGKIEEIFVDDLDSLKNVSSKDGDRLVIGEFKLNEVEIKGAVQNPGKYLINQGSGIEELIELSGGYTKNAYPFGGILENDAAKAINRISQEKLYKEFLDRLSMLASSPDAVGTSFETMITLMNEIKDAPVSGRVSAEFDLDILKNNPEKDVLLQDGDTIVIPELINQVYVFGEVQNQGSTSYIGDKDISFYIDNRGGYKSGADKRSVYILYPDGNTKKISKNIFQGKLELEVYPGSIIYVPKKINDNFLITKSAQAYATILGNIGVSLASISVLKD